MNIQSWSATKVRFTFGGAYNTFTHWYIKLSWREHVLCKYPAVSAVPINSARRQTAATRRERL
jgi:hypothetical protein